MAVHLFHLSTEDLFSRMTGVGLHMSIAALRAQQIQDTEQLADPPQDQEETQPSVHLPLKLSPFFDSGSLSDITLMVGSSIFQAHKLILSLWSPVFKEMLLERPKSDEPHVLEEAQEYEVIFSDFLKFMYTETIEISKDNVYSFHKLSKKYEVDEICDLCEEFLIGEVSNDIIALQTLTDAEEFGFTKVYDHCFKFLETNFFCLSGPSLKKMSPSLFLKLLESSDLVVKTERQLLHKALDWLYAGSDKRQDEYTEDVISKIRFAHMSFPELSILKSGLPTQRKMNDRSKQCLQDSILDAFEWKALVSCEEEELNLLPHHIRSTLSKRHFVDPRFYIPEVFHCYQTLVLSENPQQNLHIPVTGVSACNTLSEKSSTWLVTGSKFYNEKSKKWKVCYRFKPDKNSISRRPMYRLVILTKVEFVYMNPIVTTSKGVLKETVVEVEQVLHHTEINKELTAVRIKVFIMVNMRKSDHLKDQLQMLKESEEEQRLTPWGRNFWQTSVVDHIDHDFYEEY